MVDKLDHTYHNYQLNVNKAKSHYRKRHRRGKKLNHPSTSHSSLKIGYNNVNQKLSITNDASWAELQELANHNEWDVIVLVETSWQG